MAGGCDSRTMHCVHNKLRASEYMDMCASVDKGWGGNGGGVDWVRVDLGGVGRAGWSW